MKPNHTPVDRAMKVLAIGLAGLLAIPLAPAQTADADTIRRLQEENAALRKRLAEIENPSKPAAPAPAQPATAAPAATPGTTAAPAPDKGTVVLSPFNVNSDRDYGYLKINSSTATRIGTEIQKVPLNISVLSEDFIKDTGLSDIQDVLRYQSSSAGDTRMGVLQPATGFTPSGALSLRGFPISSRLRNGLARYNAYSLDAVDRVELIKGPASVFFGMAYPGGVINYVTKQPSFTKIPTQVTYQYGGNTNRMGSQRVTLDSNQVLSDTAAFRIVGAWDNFIGDRRFEYQDGFSVTPSFSFVPFKSGKLKITAEAEYLRRDRNQDDTSWQWPAQWFADYKNPPAALIAAAGLSGAADPVAAYRARIFSGPGNWIADVRKAANDPYIALWTQPLKNGAYITDAAGNRVFDEKFNYYGSGTYSDEEVAVFDVVTQFSPWSWLDGQYSFTADNSRYSEVKATASPNADGITWQTMNGIVSRDYIQESYTHQLDLVFKKKLFSVDNKLLVGGVLREAWQSYTGNNGANLAGTGQFPFFGNLPGTFDKPDEGYVSPIPPQFRSTSFGANFAQEYVRNRSGKILDPTQIYSQYDPGIHPFPDIRRITEVKRGLVDHYKPKRKEWYINWQGNALEDRLNVYAGYRKEQILANGGQMVDANPPWYLGQPYMLQNVPPALWTAYGMNEGYQKSQLQDRKGDSKMIGASFAVVPNVNVYASYSETYLPNGPFTLGGDYNENDIRARATSLGLNPDQAVANTAAAGGLDKIKNERGRNMEFGVKFNLEDSKIVSTVSIYRLNRLNRALDDSQRQTDEPLNYTGPNKTGSFSRIIRWYSNDAEQQTEGIDLDVTWTPTRNYQAVVSGSWMWQAKTIYDSTLTAANLNTPIVYGNRLPYAPEYRFNVWNKYTFDHDLIGNFGKGFSVGLGLRYASEIIISNDTNTNASRGGITAGDYVVFDAVFRYPFEVRGYRMNVGLNINNLLNEEYSEGNMNLSPPRSWALQFGMLF